jgi:dinuclear metal center YbgI/SA1388 family protein
MPQLERVVEACDEWTRKNEIADFPGAENGLQIENNGTVSKVGAAVDAGLEPFRQAIDRGIDFLICHHGIYWNPPVPLTGSNYRKISTAISANLAVYGSHLPLDAHPEIGNNALLAKALRLEVVDSFLPYEGTPIGLIAKGIPLNELKERFQEHFPDTSTFIEFGSKEPERVAILTGSGASAVDALPYDVDTLLTGELKQHHFNMAQERGLNLLLGGHYATEVFGVKALAAKVAESFNVAWEFIDTSCPL